MMIRRSRHGRILRWCGIVALSSMSIVFQTGGCALDPDILLNTGLQIAGDIGLFALQNAYSAF